MAKETYYFSHDFSARNDPKMQKLMRKHGMAGIGLYWCLIELLNEEGGYLLLSQCEDYAFALRTQCELISSLIDDFLLFENDGEKFWSESVLRRIDKRNEKSVKAKLSADKRWQDANALRTHTERNAIKERKGKEIKEKLPKDNDGIPFDAFWDLYGKKEDRAKCEAKWKGLSDAERKSAIEAIPKYFTRKTDPQFRKNPLTWLNGKCWLDESETHQSLIQKPMFAIPDYMDLTKPL